MRARSFYGATLCLSIVATLGCNRTCSTALPPSPPLGNGCITTGFDVYLSAFPDTGDLQPDYLVASGTTVSASAFAFQYYSCPAPDGTTTTGVRRPDFLWELEYVPRGGAKRQFSILLNPENMCLTPTFVATRGTWRLTFYLAQHLDIAKTITIEAADPDEWVHVGPDGRVLDCQSGSCMGRMAGITFVPNHPGMMFAAAPRGGIFRSDESGTWWYPMSDHKIVDGSAKEWAGGLATSRVVALANAHIVAATCDTDWYSGGSEGCDNSNLFYRSSDFGVTWTQSQTNCTDPNEPDVPSGPVLDLVVDPSSGSLFTVAGGHVYRSRSEGNCWRRIDPPDALLNGNTPIAATVQSLSFIDRTAHFLYVAARPSDASVEQSLNQILFNTSDSEALDPSWTAVAVGASAQGSLNTKGQSQIARIQLANADGNVYALVPVSPTDTKQPYGLKLFRGAVAGVLPTFQRTKTDPPTLCGTQCDWYDLALAANANAPAFVNELAVAGINFVVHSIDGGDSWTNIGQAHVDHHYLVFDPSGTRLWSSSDGGIAAIDFPNGGWLDRNYGLNTSLAYSASISGTDPKHALTGIGLQDNGNFARKSRGRVWDRISGCDGFQITFDANTTNTSYEGPLDCGRALNKINLQNNSEVNLGASQFFQADRYRGGRVFGINPTGANAYQLYVATNLNTQNAPPIAWRCADPQPSLAGEFVSALLTLPGDLDRPLVGNNAGDIFQTDLTKIVGNATCSATDTAGVPIYATQPAPKAPITDIAIDPQDNQSLYVAEARNDAQHVVHLVYNATTASWSPVAVGQNLPSTSTDPSTNRIAADPKSPTTLYFGSDVGLFKGSSTPSAPWTPTSVPNTTVTDVMTANGTSCDSQGIIRAATFGRGVYERFFPTGTATPACASPSPSPRPERIVVRPDGSDGFFYPASFVRFQIEYDMPERPTDLRVSGLHGRERVPAIAETKVSLKERRGTEIVTLSLSGNPPTLVDVDTVLVELLGRDGRVLTSTREPVSVQLRGANQRVVRITASLARPGAPSPLSGIAVTVGARKLTTPAVLVVPQNRGAVLDAPSTVTPPDGGSAKFAGWFGSLRSGSDWSRRSAIPGNSMSRHIELLVGSDADIDLRYAPSGEEEEERAQPIRYRRK